jgi:hypothetical protein
MIPEAKKEALAVLAEVWALSPDVRLGQLFAHLGFLSEVHLGRELGYLEDDEIMAILYLHKAELETRLRGVPEDPSRNRAATSVSGSPMLVEAATELGH